MKRVTLGILAASALVTSGADAYVLKKTTNGELVHWAEGKIALVVDSTVTKADPNAADAVRSGANQWNQKTTGAPQVSVSQATNSLEPKYDGVNSVLFRESFAPAGKAIAVTVLTYDDKSGEIVDADIVISGKYKYSTSEEVGEGRYDLMHVVAHELGHSLGLGDEDQLEDALMFGYTKSGDVSRREPSEDDVDGVSAIYSTMPAASSGGCTAAGATRGPSGPYAIGLLFGLVFYGVARRKNRLLAAAPLTIAAITTFAAQAAPETIVSNQPSQYVTAEVTHTESFWQDGMLRSRITMSPKGCSTHCPGEVTEEVWGGRKDGLVQEIAGDHVPNRGESVKLHADTMTRVMASPHFAIKATHAKPTQK